MKVLATALLAALCSNACGRDQVALEFIGEATFPTGYMFMNTEVGGLSGIDYDEKNHTYLAISDDRAQHGFARFYSLTIDLSDGRLDAGDVKFLGVTEILDQDGRPFSPGSVDPEAIRVLPGSDSLYWSSEGDASRGIAPFVRSMTRHGQPVSEFDLPGKFIPGTDSGVRNNLGFESLTLDPERNRLITASESALVQDGAEASLTGGSPARVLILNTITGKPRAEYIYVTEPVAVPPANAGGFATNGLVELLALGDRSMLAIERSFSAGAGNNIKLFLTTTRKASNVGRRYSIAGIGIKPMRKKLLLNLDETGIPLSNIEGMTLGPAFPDGSRALIFVSDNNFATNGQFTQFLAFRLTADN